MYKEDRQETKEVSVEEGLFCKIFVGLDLSLTQSGIVIVGDNGDVIKSCVSGYSLKKDAPVKEKIVRLISIASDIVSEIKSVGCDCVEVAIENYSFGTVKNRFGKGVQSASQTGLAELHGVVKSQLWMGMKIEPVVVPCKSARKVVLGKGQFKGGKKEIMAAVKEYGFETSNNNIADAYVIAEHLRLKSARS